MSPALEPVCDRLTCGRRGQATERRFSQRFRHRTADVAHRVDDLDGAGVHLPKDGKIIVTVRDKDKAEVCEMFKNMKDMQFRLYATPGTRKALMEAGVHADPVNKISGESPNIHDMLAAEDVSLIINTPTHGRLENRDGFKLRRLAVEAGCSCLTSLDAAKAIMESTRIVESDTVHLTDIATL